MAVHARELMRELERGSVFPVYLLLGEDRGTKDLFLRRLAERVIPKEQKGDSAVARSVFYGGETPPGEILSSLMTYSIFSERTLVIVHEFDQVSTTAPFIEYIDKPGSESVLVLETALNRVSQRVTASVEKRGRVSIFWPMFQNEGEQWVTRRLADLGIRAERDAVDYIVELSGTGRSELENQVLNVSTYLEEGEHLSLEKARDIVSQIHGYTVFDLTGALFTKPARDIIAIFRALIDNGEEPGKLFYFCNREIEKLLQACALKSAGKDFATIARILKMRKKESQRFGSLMQRMEVRTLRTLYSDLHLLDRTLKSSPRELALSSFERFVAGLGRT
jgi:DNA polymerase III delta subunit